MFCKNCGSKISDGALFCNNCSAPVEATPVEEVVAAEPAYVTEVQPEEIVEAAPENAKDPGKLFGILSLIFGGCGLAFMCVPCLNYVAWLFAIAGITLGVIGTILSKKAGFKNIMALVGAILGVVYFVLVITIIVIYFVILLIAAMTGSL